jgi:hypothetical protein
VQETGSWNYHTQASRVQMARGCHGRARRRKCQLSIFKLYRSRGKRKEKERVTETFSSRKEVIKHEKWAPLSGTQATKPAPGGWLRCYSLVRSLVIGRVEGSRAGRGSNNPPRWLEELVRWRCGLSMYDRQRDGIRPGIHVIESSMTSLILFREY